MADQVLGSEIKPTLNKVTLCSPSGYIAEVYTHGAHVTKWATPSGEDLLFLSDKAIFNPPKAIRGGIPICFPQFGDMGPCTAQHGFARNSTFEIESVGSDTVKMVLNSPAGGLTPEYSHQFQLSISTSVSVDGTLQQEMLVKNTTEDPNSTPMKFTAAFHTYFKLRGGGIDSTAIVGLQGIRYLDSLLRRKECVQEDERVIFPGEVDRIYCGAPELLTIFVGDQELCKLSKDGFKDAVVWNPGANKARLMADFGDDEWKDMVCVEVAQAGSGPIELKAGEEWRGAQTLSCEAINSHV